MLQEKVIGILSSKNVFDVILTRSWCSDFTEVSVESEEDLLQVFKDLDNIEGKVIEFAPVQTHIHVNTIALPVYCYKLGDKSYYMSNFRVYE